MTATAHIGPFHERRSHFHAWADERRYQLDAAARKTHRFAPMRVVPVGLDAEGRLVVESSFADWDRAGRPHRESRRISELGPVLIADACPGFVGYTVHGRAVGADSDACRQNSIDEMAPVRLVLARHDLTAIYLGDERLELVPLVRALAGDSYALKRGMSPTRRASVLAALEPGTTIMTRIFGVDVAIELAVEWLPEPPVHAPLPPPVSTSDRISEMLEPGRRTRDAHAAADKRWAAALAATREANAWRCITIGHPVTGFPLAARFPHGFDLIDDV